MKQNQDAIAEYTVKTQVSEFLYRSNFDLNASMTGFVAPDMLCIESQNEKMRLSEMVKDRPLLIFRFMESSCKPCNMDLLAQIQTELSDNVSIVNMFYSNKTERELLIFKNTYHIILPLYLIPPSPFDWTVEENNAPYFFILHPDMKISYIYVPDKDFPELNKKYLEGVKRFLASKAS